MNAKHVPDYILERYVLGELPPEQMGELDAMVRHNALIRRRTDVIRESSKSIIRRYPPASMAARIHERAAQSPDAQSKSGLPRPVKKMLFVPALAAAAALIIVIAYPFMRSGYDPGMNPFVREVTRVKGADTGIYVYRKKESSAEVLANNDRVRARDLLQLAYFSANNSHGVIVSIDGRGGVTLHLPASRNAGSRIVTNRKILLPSSYELDDAPGFERFIFITSRRPIDVRAVYTAAEKVAKNPATGKTKQLPLDGSLGQRSLLLLKE